MGRSNVIIVGSVVLAPLILGMESYLLWGTHHHRARIAQITGSPEASPGPVFGPPVEQTAVVPTSSRRPLPPPPPAPVATNAAAAENPLADTGTVSDSQADPTVERRRQLMLQRRGEDLQAADEQVVDLLHLTDQQSAAIRTIDSAYARTLQAIGQLPPGADLRSAGLDPNAEQARRAAIGEVLGPDITPAFTVEERKAARRARNQHRVEQVRGR
jgi:hypothetical protein